MKHSPSTREKVLIWFLWGGAIFLTLINWMDGRGIWGDLTTHFPAHFWVAFLLFGAWFLFRRQWWMLIVNLVCLGWYSATLAPFYIRQGESPQSVQLRVAAANIYRQNVDCRLLIEWIAAEQPDIILLTEAGPPHVQVLDSVWTAYPFRVAVPLEGYFGMVLYSRMPILEAETPWIVNAPVATIFARIQIGVDTLDLWGVHPPSPPRVKESIWRNAYFDNLARHLGRYGPHARIVVGDFNLTPTNQRFRDFQEATGLRDSRIGNGLIPSWPAGLSGIGIALDHALISPDLLVGPRRGPDLGSDHLPMIYDLGWKK
ncbi:MAG: endonuclease/exonuclease/phosphatase family protein [Bacteroidota bacterium]